MLKTAVTTGFLLALASLNAFAGETERVYKWVDEDGQIHYGDSIPPEYSDLPKQVLNEHSNLGEQVGHMWCPAGPPCLQMLGHQHPTAVHDISTELSVVH